MKLKTLGFGKLLLFPVDGKDSERQKLRWIVSLRLHMSFGILIFAALGVRYDFLRPDKYVLFFSSIIISLTITATSYFIWKKEIKISQSFIFLQLILDLFIFTALIFASGGIENPFTSVFYLHAILGGMLLPVGFSTAYLFFVLLSIAYVQFLTIEHLDFTSSQLLPIFLAQYFVTMASWFLARSLQRHLILSQEKLNQLKIASERMDRLRSVGALTAGLSHEFASPLNTVKIQLERIKRKDQRPSESDDYQVLMQSLDRCSDVLKKMNMVQLDSSLHGFEKIQVKELVTEIVGVWKGDFENTGVEINIDHKFALSLPVLNFTQVILNLLDNAVEACTQDAAIFIHSQEDALVIEDNGSGFSQDVLMRFGEPFNSNKTTGTGLGLYSSLLFMNSLGGTIEIKNKTSSSGAVIALIFPSEQL
jgi:two-component system sensor histidine kinase RegB